MVNRFTSRLAAVAGAVAVAGLLSAAGGAAVSASASASASAPGKVTVQADCDPYIPASCHGGGGGHQIT